MRGGALKLYQTGQAEIFRRMDRTAALAEVYHVGLLSSGHGRQCND
jgi:hypothetical protein